MLGVHQILRRMLGVQQMRGPAGDGNQCSFTERGLEGIVSKRRDAPYIRYGATGAGAWHRCASAWARSPLRRQVTPALVADLYKL